MADKVFGQTVPPEQRVWHRRIVFMILDGMTTEQDADQYLSALEPNGLELVVLNIKVR